MGKRKNTARATDPTGPASEKLDRPTPGIARPAVSLPPIESPDLVPPQAVAVEGEAAGGGPATPPVERIALPADLPATPAAPDVITVSFAQAAAGAAGHTEASARGPATAGRVRSRRLIPLAVTAAIAAAVGALGGALGAAGMSHLLASDAAAPAASRNRLVQESIAKIGADVAALKANVETSAKSANAQFARLGERLDRADRAQAESAGKLAKLAESLDHRVAATPTATGNRLVTGSLPATPPPQAHAPATRPAGQPIVEGWVLRNVVNGAAVIQGRIGLVQIEPGDSLPTLGRIEAIRRQDGRWVVVTTRGLIIAR